MTLHQIETMAEVEKLMSSPEFKSEMEALMEKPEMKAAIEAAQEMMQDPEKMQAVMTDIQKGMAGLAEGLTGTGGGKSAASLGLDGLAQAAGDSNFLKEALGMLDDPEVQAEVKKLMEDPSFKAEMEGMMARPEYQEAMKKAQDELAELSKDPAKFAELQEQARAMMNS
jgi:tripartite-type tricarboxylate transporter receptor subunit TctC